MIKIDKNLTDVPPSLQVPPTTPEGKKTAEIRQAVIKDGQYPKKSTKTDNRYKTKDIKSALSLIYHDKCAFCEQRVEQWHVEHFRPKSIYYWLAFSWDNLLYACAGCNIPKSDHFDVENPRATAPLTDSDLTGINILSTTYDTSEQRKFFHPELQDPAPLLIFQDDGLISTTDTQLTYTIQTCKIDRKYLNDYRKKIWDDFINHIKSEVVEGKSKDQIRLDVMALVRQFQREAENISNEYIAFRRYAIKHFLVDTLNKILN